jgi:hypothetical protein
MTFFDKIKAALKSRESTFDCPPWITDSRAARTSWKPLKGGGANFKTQTVAKDGAMQDLLIKSSLGGKLFAGVFVGISLIVPIAVAGPQLEQINLDSFDLIASAPLILPVVVMLVFAIAGGQMVRGMLRPVRVRPTAQMIEFGKNDSVSFGEVSALQIVQEWVRGNKSSYYSYELNLVLADGKRRNLMDHGSYSAIAADANKLAGAMNRIPVWDAVKAPEGFSTPSA